MMCHVFLCLRSLSDFLPCLRQQSRGVSQVMITVCDLMVVRP